MCVVFPTHLLCSRVLRSAVLWTRKQRFRLQQWTRTVTAQSQTGGGGRKKSPHKDNGALTAVLTAEVVTRSPAVTSSTDNSPPSSRLLCVHYLTARDLPPGYARAYPTVPKFKMRLQKFTLINIITIIIIIMNVSKEQKRTLSYLCATSWL